MKMTWKIIIINMLLAVSMPCFAWPTLKALDNQASAQIRISAHGTSAGNKIETIAAGDLNNQLYWPIPGAWGGGYIKIELISRFDTKTYYLQLLQVDDDSPKLATLRTDLQGKPVSQLRRDVEDISIRTYPKLELIEGILATKDLILRDGCKNWGDPCKCGAPFEGFLKTGDRCNTGFCFKGLQYGDESLYCNCNFYMLTDEQIKEAEKLRGRTVKIDDACSRKPTWGYDGKGAVELGNKLKKLQDEGLFFTIKNPEIQKNDSEAQKLSRQYGVDIRIKQSIDEIVDQVQYEMRRLYTTGGIPNMDLINLYENEDPNSWKKPCEYFQRILQMKINAATGGKPTFSMSKDVIDVINTMCPENPGPKNNDDPCICGNTKRPGVCQVSNCDLELKCRCD